MTDLKDWYLSKAVNHIGKVRRHNEDRHLLQS